MRRRLLSTIALMTMSASCAVGQSVPCSATDSKNALDQADRLRTWQTLYRTYKRYDQCDDGGIGEGFSESVARILADHWRTLPQLSSLVKRDAGFRRFVLRHIDATLNPDDVNKIISKANASCPVGLGSLCNDIKKNAAIALKEGGDDNPKK